jgi:hypothetical protein
MLRRLLGPPLKLDFEVALLTVYTTLALMVDYYWTFTPNKYVDRVILYLLIPLLLIVLVLRKHPAQYGMTFGDWKAGLVITTLAIGAMTIILWLLVHNDASMQKYYAPLWSGRFLGVHLPRLPVVRLRPPFRARCPVDAVGALRPCAHQQAAG